MVRLSNISKLLVPIITTKFFGQPMPGAIRSVGVDTKIEKQLFLSKVKGLSCVSFCAMQELSVQLKTSWNFYLRLARLLIQMEVR